MHLLSIFPHCRLLDPDRAPPLGVSKTLVEILSWPRPADSPAEADFVDHYLLPKLEEVIDQAHSRADDGLTQTRYLPPEKDAYGHVWVRMADAQTPDRASEERRVLITAHTHIYESRDNERRTLLLFPANFASNARITLAPEQDHEARLGATDGVGIFCALNLIAYGKPYDFVFYRGFGEDFYGGAQSASFEPERYAIYDAAIAFCKSGSQDVVTHQPLRSASDAFAQALADMLNTAVPSCTPLEFSTSDDAVFSETAILAHLIPECSNVSVGVFQERRPDEYLDWSHVLQLVGRICAKDCDFNRLPISRKPKLDELLWIMLKPFTKK